MVALVVSAKKPHVTQDRLWDWVGDRELASVAQARPYVGDFYEEATRVAMGATRHQIDSTADYCPDLSLGAGRFLECKAIGATGQGLVFSDRIAKDSRLVRQGGELTYLFWRHGVRVEDHQTLHGLRAALAAKTEQVLAVPFQRLRKAVKGLREVCLLNTDRGDRMGYRLPWKMLSELGSGPVSTELPRCRVHNCDLRPVTLYGPNLGRCFPVPTEAERAAASTLHSELCQQRLEVVLDEAPEPRYRGHRVRTVISENPAWYQRLCRGYAKKRGPGRKRSGHHEHDTDIRRCFVESALQRLADGHPPTHEYDFRVLPIVRREAQSA